MSFYLTNRNRLDQPLMTDDRFGETLENGDLDFAIRHARANKIGYDDPDKEKFRCPCCMMNVNKVDFSYSCSVDDLSIVGVGYTLYFKLMMNLKYLMIVLTICHSAITFYLNVRGKFCKVYNPIDALNHNLCEWNVFNVTSLANRVDEEKKTNRQVYIDGIFFYILMVSLFIIRLNLFYEVIKSREKRGFAINDFSIYCLNLPKMGTIRLRVLLQRHFKNLSLGEGISYELENISFCMDNREYNQLVERKEELQSQIKNLMNTFAPTKKQENENKIAFLEKEHKDVADKIKEVLASFEKSQYTYDPVFTRKAFITFKIYGAAHDILHRFSQEFVTTVLWRKGWNYCQGKDKSRVKLEFEDEKLVVYPAVYPTNFIWENASVSNLQKFSRRAVIIFIEFILFLISVYIVWQIARYQIDLRRKMLFEQVEESVRSKQYVIMQLIGIGTTFVVVGVNKVCAILLRNLVNFEMHEKKTSMDTSIAEKLSLQYFINSSLTLFIVHSYYENIWKYGGLVYLAAFFMITNCFAKISACYVDVWYIMKNMQKWYYLKNRPKMSQRRLNSIFEYNEFDFASYTASILSANYHCFFYASMVPLVGIANIITQTFEYYLHKYVIIVRCSSKKKFGNTLLVQILNYVDLSLIFYALGTMLTYFVFINRLPNIYWINLCVAIIYNLMPLNHITRKLIKVPKKQFLKRYKDYRTAFDEDNYNLYNPVNVRNYVEMTQFNS